MPPRAIRSRKWVFTVNNYTPETTPTAASLPGATWCCFGREVGAGGTPHLQGAVYFRDAKTMGAVRLLLPGAHLEPMRGTFVQARDYSIKDGDFVEWGGLIILLISRATSRSTRERRERKETLGRRLGPRQSRRPREHRSSDPDPVLRRY